MTLQLMAVWLTFTEKVEHPTKVLVGGEGGESLWTYPYLSLTPIFSFRYYPIPETLQRLWGYTKYRATLQGKETHSDYVWEQGERDFIAKLAQWGGKEISIYAIESDNCGTVFFLTTTHEVRDSITKTLEEVACAVVIDEDQYYWTRVFSESNA